LPEDAEWALPLLELAVAALNLDVNQRPQDSRSALARLDAIAAARLAAHQEIAEVVQGITAVSTLCIPEPTLPSVDACCQESTGMRGPGSSRCGQEPSACYQAPKPEPQRVHILNSFEPPAPRAAPPVLVSAPAVAPTRASQPRKMWFGVALLWLATLGLLAGYVMAVLAQR
jgi:hypothetical protein